VSLELATTAALFGYYNDKISSLRNAIQRDAKKRNPNIASDELQDLLKTGTYDENVQALKLLLDKHKELRERMEALNEDLAPPAVM
jgi:hypothetical protein